MAKLQQPNTHKVPDKQWKKWPDICQRVFNSTYEDVQQNQSLLIHPMAATQVQECWNTTAWNVAWLAADNTLRALKDIEKGVGYAE